MMILLVISSLVVLGFVFIVIGYESKDGTGCVTDFAAWVFFIVAISLIAARFQGHKW